MRPASAGAVAGTCEPALVAAHDLADKRVAGIGGCEGPQIALYGAESADLIYCASNKLSPAGVFRESNVVCV